MQRHEVEALTVCENLIESWSPAETASGIRVTCKRRPQCRPLIVFRRATRRDSAVRAPARFRGWSRRPAVLAPGHLERQPACAAGSGQVSTARGRQRVCGLLLQRRRITRCTMSSSRRWAGGARDPEDRREKGPIWRSRCTATSRPGPAAARPTSARDPTGRSRSRSALRHAGGPAQSAARQPAPGACRGSGDAQRLQSTSVLYHISGANLFTFDARTA